MELTRIGVAGDWHCNTNWAHYQIKHMAEKLSDQPYPLILQLGDFGIWNDDAGRAYRQILSNTLDEVNGYVFFIDGNHEDHDWLDDKLKHRWEADEGTIFNGAVPIDPAENIWWLPRGNRWTWHGREWLACGGAVSVDKKWRTEGVDWWPQEEITFQQISEISEAGHADVMVTHDCPTSVYLNLPVGIFPHKDVAIAERHRDKLQQIVFAVKPEYLMHGHYHMWYQKFIATNWAKMRVDGLDMDGTQGNWFILNIETMEWEP